MQADVYEVESTVLSNWLHVEDKEKKTDQKSYL